MNHEDLKPGGSNQSWHVRPLDWRDEIRLKVLFESILKKEDDSFVSSNQRVEQAIKLWKSTTFANLIILENNMVRGIAGLKSNHPALDTMTGNISVELEPDFKKHRSRA